MCLELNDFQRVCVLRLLADEVKEASSTGDQESVVSFSCTFADLFNPL